MEMKKVELFELEMPQCPCESRSAFTNIFVYFKKISFRNQKSKAPGDILVFRLLVRNIGSDLFYLRSISATLRH